MTSKSARQQRFFFGMEFSIAEEILPPKKEKWGNSENLKKTGFMQKKMFFWMCPEAMIFLCHFLLFLYLLDFFQVFALVFDEFVPGPMVFVKCIHTLAGHTCNFHDFAFGFCKR